MDDGLYMQLMKLLPKSALSSAVGQATRLPVPPAVHHAAIRLFAQRFRVNLDEAEGRIEDYPTFGQFFTRRLKPGLRPIDPAPEALVSPVDGAVSEAGEITQGRCLQAKGITFPVDKLLGDPKAAQRFDGGLFATIYLSPRDYHRIHAPVAGKITGYTYLPGALWPVNPASVRNTDALFAINERLVVWLDTSFGPMAVVAVGATCVGRIHLSFDAVVTHAQTPARSRTYDTPIAVEKGGELGMFEMGSTVILLAPPGKVRWEPGLTPSATLRLGQRIGSTR
ncbi:MAG: archaetidylserine decarboxylase [Myxococcaceae bacterium]|nr:archaetidylserine decarboxylase [Myxococcaceae bacterium]